MTINEHATDFAGLAVRDWEPDEPLDDPAGAAFRISLSYEETEEGAQWTDKLARFLERPEVERVTALVVGPWGEVAVGDSSARVVEALVAARDRLSSLRAIFIGDIISEESEISWIIQSDVSPLFDAYPQSHHLRLRGGNELSLGTPRHAHLRSLVIESGGLGAGVVRQVTAGDLPALEHLELWLGVDQYGGTTTVEDLRPILDGTRFPNLRYLGLRDSEIADQIAGAVAQAPILERIEVLDLSLGTLGDDGAAALLASPTIRRLKKLDVHHHYCSDQMTARLAALGIDIDCSDQQKDEWFRGERSRYVAVSE